MNSRLIFFAAILISAGSLKAQNLEWAKSIGGTNLDWGFSVVTDQTGNVYTTGYFSDTVDFDPGLGVSNLAANSGSADVFIQKLDTAGNLIWAKAFGGPLGDVSYANVVDNSGYIYSLGAFSDTADFDPGPGTFNLNSEGFGDIFIQKMDSAGNFLWAKSFGGIYDDRGLSIHTDASGNVYTTGRFRGTVDFDPGPGLSNLTTSLAGSAFVHKMDSSGNFLWVKAIQGSSVGEEIRLDPSGNIIITGFYSGTSDFDPGPGTSNLTSVGSFDIFVQKMNSAGNYLWAQSIGGIADDRAFGMATDNFGNVFLTGYFTNTADFDPGLAIANLVSAGNIDAFVLKLDASGNYVWAKAIRGTLPVVGHDIEVDAVGNVYTAGNYFGTADFDPGVGINNISSEGGFDIFIQRLDSMGNFSEVNSFGSSGQDEITAIHLDASNNIYTTGRFEFTVDFDPGPDTLSLTSTGDFDIYVKKLAQCLTSFGADTVIACDAYTWINGITYTASNNTATDTLTSVQGCDSIVTLNLIINNTSTTTQSITACDSYKWVDGNTYTQSNNTAFIVLTNQFGCDSIVNLDLTINTVSDTTTTLSGTSLTANNINASYQWLNCDNNFAIIPGEVNRTFKAAQNGNYAVELTENGCVDTSACRAISTIVGILENSFGHTINLFPNPINNELFISLGRTYENINISISSIAGSIVYEENFENAERLQLFLDFPAGFYFLRFSSSGNEAVFKLLKE